MQKSTILAPTDTYEKQIAEILREFGISGKYRDMRPFPEAAGLVSIGQDICGREQNLAASAAAAWRGMKSAAEQEGVTLLLVSAFRSVAYQRQIIERKLAAGQSMEQILQASAAPGYSEHHTGKTVDITAPGSKPLTEEFEQTTAFAWLVRRAGDFGFSMTYPRNNNRGVIYEPWHWTFQEAIAERPHKSMQIRAATIAHAQRIAQIHVETWRAAYRGQMPDAVLDNLDVEKRAAFWHTHLTNQSLGTFVAELNQEVVGFCDLVPSRDKDSNPQVVAEIVAIYVHPKHWRQGAGRELCDCALATARLKNFTAVTLWVLNSNIGAQKFYQTMGFYLDGATKSELMGNYEIHEVRFRVST